MKLANNKVYCKYCNNFMKGAHPNKKFCSNKGKGNCKDAYHNMRKIKEEDFDAGHFFSSGYFGHGQE